MLHDVMQAEQEMHAAEHSQSEELSDADVIPEVPVPVDVVVASSNPPDKPGMTQPRSTVLTAAAADNTIAAAAAANEHEGATPAADVVPSSQSLAQTAAAPDVLVCALDVTPAALGQPRCGCNPPPTSSCRP